MNNIIKDLNEHFLSKRKEKWVKIWESRFPKWIDQIEEIRKSITDKDILNKSVDELDFSCRPHNCLMVSNIRTIGELIEKNPCELLLIKNMGVKTVEEIMTKLYQLSWEIINNETNANKKRGTK